MENKRRIFDIFLGLNLSTRLELLKWLDEICNFEFTDSECVFYEFNQSGLESFFRGYDIVEMFNIFKNSDVDDSYHYFYKDCAYNSIVMCTEDFIHNKIIENKGLITDNILNYIKEIKEDLGIDFTDPKKLQLGDYVSIEIDNDFKLLQLIKRGSHYNFIDVDTFEAVPVNIDGEYDSISEWAKEENATIYHVDHKAVLLEKDYETIEKLAKPCKFLVYDKENGEDFKVLIRYNQFVAKYQILIDSSESTFYEELFNTFNDAVIKLLKDYRLVKKIRE